MVAAVVSGLGAVGARAARQLHSLAGTELSELRLVSGDPARAREAATSIGNPAVDDTWDAALAGRPDVVVLAGRSGHVGAAEAALAAGAHVVSVSDDPGDADGLLALDAAARAAGRAVVVGAGFSPGLACLLARHAAGWLDGVDEVHVARHGIGGPACARRHHASLTGAAVEVVDGAPVEVQAFTGRQLCWFPEPVSARDCYRSVTAEPLLLRAAFPEAQRITARRSASLLDRLTAALPMLRPPHPEGMVGALRVEVSGHAAGAASVHVLGVIDRPAVAAGTVAAAAAWWAATGRLARSGAGGLASMVDDTVDFLEDLSARGVRAAVFARS